MVRHFRGCTPYLFFVSIFAAILLVSTGDHAVAQEAGITSAEDLLSDETCLYISIPDPKAFRESFLITDLGKLANDPAMKPFADDLTDQIRSRFGETQLQLGLKWEDLESVASGEICFAQSQPGKQKGADASVLLVDTTGNNKEAQELLQTVDKTMAERKATKSTVKIGEQSVTHYKLPQKSAVDLKQREVMILLDEGQLLISSDLPTLDSIIQCRASGKPGSLSSNAIYQHVMEGVAKKSKGLKPQLRWYLDPFAAADVVRAARGERSKRSGKSMIRILQDQGFDAIRAVGGHINLATEDHDVLHRSYVYAPPLTEDETRYKGAARLLKFPESSHLPLPSWVPRELATFTSMNWEILNGFNYGSSLVDEVVDSPNFVNEVLKSFKEDKSGPMIDIRSELLAHADDHVIVFSDFQLPINTDSERILVGIRLKDQEKVEKALEKLWKADPQAEKIPIGKYTVWQIIPEDEEDVPDLIFAAPGIVEEEEEDEYQLPNAAMTVARGEGPDAKPYLLVATQIDLLRKVLQGRPAHNQLQAAADFRHVNQMLVALGSGIDSLLFFSRTDEEFRSAYELIKQGKMPQSESMLGKILNRFLGPGPEEKNVIRKQEIDGKNLPEFQVARRHLGPAGVFMKPTDDGWFVTGIMVSKRKLVDKQEAARANLTTALAP